MSVEEIARRWCLRHALVWPMLALAAACGTSSGGFGGGISPDASASSGSGSSGSGSGGEGSSSGASSSGSSGGASSGTSSGGSGSGGSTSSSGASGSSSGGGGDGGLPADESEWLDPMNTARSAVGDAPLGWDPIAAAVAQAWANGCSFEHNPDASADYDKMGGKGALGENIAAGAPTETPPAAVADWVAEEKYYDHANNTCAGGQVCGHYTQIVWSTTTAAGCAHADCTKNSPFGSGAWGFNVCDFSPAGNIIGKSPY